MHQDEKKIKVLEVIQQGEIGGGESHLLTLIGKMDRTVFEPVVVALSDGEMVNRLTAMGVKSYVVHTKLPFNITVWKQLGKILREEKIDIVHTHGARSLSNLIYPSRRLSIPIVHTVHGWSFHDHLPAWKRTLRIKGEKFLTSRAAMNIAVSESNKQIGLKSFGEFRCEVINNGVDLSLYDGGNRDGIRQEFKIPSEALVISFVARFIHDKNPMPLIRAFARVQKDFPETWLIMAGNGPAQEDAKQLAESLGLRSRIIFPGFRTDVSDLLAASDIFCLPSIKEGLPVSLIEAMAMRNAVIATTVPGCVDVVTDKEDGLLVPLAGLKDGLTNALYTLLSAPAFRQRLVIAGRKKVEQRFNAVVMTRKIEDLYKHILL